MISDEIKKNFKQLCSSIEGSLEEAPGILSCESNGVCLNLIDETDELTLVREKSSEVKIKYFRNPKNIRIDSKEIVVEAENADLIIKGRKFFVKNKE